MKKMDPHRSPFARKQTCPLVFEPALQHLWIGSSYLCTKRLKKPLRQVSIATTTSAIQQSQRQTPRVEYPSGSGQLRQRDPYSDRDRLLAMSAGISLNLRRSKPSSLCIGAYGLKFPSVGPAVHIGRVQFWANYGTWISTW